MVRCRVNEVGHVVIADDDLARLVKGWSVGNPGVVVLSGHEGYDKRRRVSLRHHVGPERLRVLRTGPVGHAHNAVDVGKTKELPPYLFEYVVGRKDDRVVAV